MLVHRWRHRADRTSVSHYTAAHHTPHAFMHILIVCSSPGKHALTLHTPTTLFRNSLHVVNATSNKQGRLFSCFPIRARFPLVVIKHFVFLQLACAGNGFLSLWVVADIEIHVPDVYACIHTGKGAQLEENGAESAVQDRTLCVGILLAALDTYFLWNLDRFWDGAQAAHRSRAREQAQAERPRRRHRNRPGTGM
ncbi:hypothetical protein K437DRAFT_254450 [Tilletiaria anomala UBC 951]|uniref:Uncharacterized protein n=1 Tax=Tilletiaria anomala (strain ATCC 24038 / CBS 436.72 / UBC 951) TaxID=1037660 RepID=A0A066WES4_TILAU|nr:uncharacterized protein K437DRAFT_254450 [Tilletiaria anomala UBC 951]KDN52261.1 hypothetical protein K437DRAFT_254450 [Tilletiaria anomala UBC 951]